jgi:hypothetical protein
MKTPHKYFYRFREVVNFLVIERKANHTKTKYDKIFKSKTERKSFYTPTLYDRVVQ